MAREMTHLEEVRIASLAVDRFREVLSPDEDARVHDAAVRGAARLSGRTVWNVNSTARGGGVAEMLATLLAYACGAGVDARWLVISGRPEFFRITKRIHNRLHGASGDGGALDGHARAVYEAAMSENGAALRPVVRAGDIVVLHDPQTAGLAPSLRDAGAIVVWRCHVGVDVPNEVARETWRFMQPYISAAHACVFSRAAFAWDLVAADHRVVIPPSIDAFSPKNQELVEGAETAILEATGLRAGASPAPPAYVRLDGSAATVTRRAVIDEDRPLRQDERFVVQVSRWDALKDPLGVIEGFAHHVPTSLNAHLVYAGPAVEAVTDDPEGVEVLVQARAYRQGLPAGIRERVHLALLPMDDLEENAAIVNALQRSADVVVQKSLAEGFGLTVSEAMWKAKPVVASRIGGIADQIVHGASGLLVDDPRDLAAFGSAVEQLLRDPSAAAAMGRSARERVRQRFLGSRSLLDYLDLFDRLLSAAG
jgi:trehalose synthase